MRTYSSAARCADCVRRADRAYGAADAHDPAGDKSEIGGGWGRHARISGASGARLSETKHVHVIGLGGSAMAPLSGMCRERGFRVTRSYSGWYAPASAL